MTKQARIFFLIYIACCLIALAWSNLHTPAVSSTAGGLTERGSNAVAILVHNT